MPEVEQYQWVYDPLSGNVAFKNTKVVKEEDMTDIQPIVAKDGFKFGCDPELFVVDSSGKAVCPTFVPGTKEAPFKVEGGAVQRDGMAAEFNIDPVTNFEDFDANIKMVMKQLKGFLPSGHKFSIVPSVEFDPAVFDAAPEDAKELGCSPDFDAWTGYKNSPPCCSDKPFLRTASGHLHIGWRDEGATDTPQHMMNCRDLVKQLDWYLAAWSLKVDQDPTRRLLYGKAGAMRPKPYGVEYRVLSNFWIVDKSKRLLVWNRMQQAILDMRKNFAPDKFRTDWNDALVRSINTSELNPSIEQIASYPVKSIANASYFA